MTKIQKVRSGGGGLMIGVGYFSAFAMIALLALAVWARSVVMGVTAVTGLAAAVGLAAWGGLRIKKFLRPYGS